MSVGDHALYREEVRDQELATSNAAGRAVSDVDVAHHHPGTCPDDPAGAASTSPDLPDGEFDAPLGTFHRRGQ